MQPDWLPTLFLRWLATTGLALALGLVLGLAFGLASQARIRFRAAA